MLLSSTTNIKHAKLYAEAGFDAIDVSFCATVVAGEKHDSILDGEDWKARIQKERERCDELGLRVVSIHMPYKYQFTEDDFPWKYEMMKRSLAAAEILGAKWAVMHMKKPQDMIPMLKKMYEETQVQSVGIAFEKSGNKSAEDLVELHDAAKEAALPVGICLDVGHFHIKTYYEYDLIEWVHKLGSRIQMLHMHDNFRTGDSHTIPYNGSIPWEDLMRALKDVGYPGVFNYELAYYGLPDELKPACLRYCKEIATYLIKIFDEHQPE